jgi:hypothetical protein
MPAPDAERRRGAHRIRRCARMRPASRRTHGAGWVPWFRAASHPSGLSPLSVRAQQRGSHPTRRHRMRNAGVAPTASAVVHRGGASDRCRTGEIGPWTTPYGCDPCAAPAHRSRTGAGSVRAQQRGSHQTHRYRMRNAGVAPTASAVVPAGYRMRTAGVAPTASAVVPAGCRMPVPTSPSSAVVHTGHSGRATRTGRDTGRRLRTRRRRVSASDGARRGRRPR